MHLIDGSHGEGGGQLLRTAVALSAITGQPIRVDQIRAKRDNPGLAPQHVAAVKAVAALCGAKVEGLALRSQSIIFRPGQPHGGRFRFDVGTAGSITLVLQAVMPVALCADAPVRLEVAGGTDVRAAPPVDYLLHVLLPLLARLGVAVSARLIRRGYYPRGGGEVEIEIQPAARLQPLLLEIPGPVREITGLAHVANLPPHIVERMVTSAQRQLAGLADPRINQQVLGQEAAFGAGGAIVLVGKAERTILGSAAVAERGVPAERLGAQAGAALRADIESGATLDEHACDQILIYLALAHGDSAFTARRLTSHTRTTMWLLEQFLPARFDVHDVGTRVNIRVRRLDAGHAINP